MKKKIVICFLIISLIIVSISIFSNYIFKNKYKNYIVAYSETYGLDPALVYAIVKVESNFDNNATSSAGAIGLMQLIPSTSKWIASELKMDYNNIDLFNPEININFGCFYLNYLFKKFDNVDVVVCAYNAGETIVKNWLDDDGKIVENKINYPETLNYYNKVMKYFKIYSNKKIFE